MTMTLPLAEPPDPPGDDPDSEREVASAETLFEGMSRRRWLECYVLRAIGSLPPADRQALDAMTPKLQELYGVQGDWQDIVAAVLDLPPTMPEAILEVWNSTWEMARQDGVLLDSRAFAEIFVEANFPA